TVTIGSQNYTATVSGGAYSVTIPKQVVGTEITAKQTLNSKTSSSVNTTVMQGTVAAPTIKAVTTDDTIPLSKEQESMVPRSPSLLVRTLIPVR
ncbi:hypothetical protein HCI99_16370, partial [Listeria booriae]